MTEMQIYTQYFPLHLVVTESVKRVQLINVTVASELQRKKHLFATEKEEETDREKRNKMLKKCKHMKWTFAF